MTAVDLPQRIIVCAVMGDWVEWDRDELPEAYACPFGDCPCIPAVYEQTTPGNPDPDDDD